MQGYRKAKQYETEDFTVLLGTELRFYATVNDYLIYGVTEEMLYELPFLLPLYIKKASRLFRERGCVFLQAHPFRKFITRANPKHLDGVEVFIPASMTGISKDGDMNVLANTDQEVKVVEIKEIRMFSTIDTHDFETKAAQAVKFLKGGDKLKVSVRFRKRAIAHPQLGEELLEKFKAACAEVGTVEKPAKMEGRALVMFVTPKAAK